MLTSVSNNGGHVVKLRHMLVIINNLTVVSTSSQE